MLDAAHTPTLRLASWVRRIALRPLPPNTLLR